MTVSRLTHCISPALQWYRKYLSAEAFFTSQIQLKFQIWPTLRTRQARKTVLRGKETSLQSWPTCHEKRDLWNFLPTYYLNLICSNTSGFRKSSQSQFLLGVFKTKNKQKREVVRVQEEVLGWRMDRVVGLGRECFNLHWLFWNLLGSIHWFLKWQWNCTIHNCGGGELLAGIQGPVFYLTSAGRWNNSWYKLENSFVFTVCWLSDSTKPERCFWNV